MSLFSFRPSKNDLRIDLAVSNAKLFAAEETIRDLRERITNHEELLNLERLHAENERQRADRLNDAVLQGAGLPPVTTTVLTEQAEKKDAADIEFEKRRSELFEMYGDTSGEVGIDLPQHFAELQAQLLNSLVDTGNETN